MKALLLVILYGAMLSNTGYGQQPDTTLPGRYEQLELDFEQADPEQALSHTDQYAQFLQELARNPVNINYADTDELLQVPGMSLRLAAAVVAYRENEKPFESVDELDEVEGIGPVTLERIRPYATVGSGAELSRTLYTDYRYWTDEGRFELYSRYRRVLERQEGYLRGDSSGYLGSPVRYYQRLRYSSNHLSVNLTQDKDAGEPLAHPLEFDFTSGHLALAGNGKLDQLVIGDYNVAFGQGLVIGQGSSFGKGSSVAGSGAKNGRGVRPYTSSSETGFFRGVAASFGRRAQITGLYARQKVGAAVVEADTTRLPREGGLHRTAREIENRRNLGRTVYGGRFRMEWPFGFIGTSGYLARFDSFIDPGTALYRRYDFRGATASVIGLDYNIIAGGTQFFGEGARSRNGGVGVVAGMQSTIDERTEFVITYRNYGKDFQSLFGNGFGERSGEPQNETGLYMGLHLEPGAATDIDLYFDQYRFPAPRFGVGRATSGFEWLARIETRLTPDLDAYLQLRSELKEDEYERAGSSGRMERAVGDALRSGIRLHLEYRVSNRIRLRTRGEMVISRPAGGEHEQGYLLYQDLRFQPGDSWTFDARVTVFETESYESRLYQYENDLLYVFGNQLLYGEGQRLYLLGRCEINGVLDIWAKLGVTLYENRPSVGSGLDESRGNRRSELGVQVRVRI